MHSVSLKNVFQKERMEKSIETVRGNFNAVRTGRANPAMLDRVEVYSSFFTASVYSMYSICYPSSTCQNLILIKKGGPVHEASTIVGSEKG